MFVPRREVATVDEFVAFWSNAYWYPDDHLYSDNIGKPLTADSVRALFRWKNGTPLSRKKRDSLEVNFVGRLDDLRQLNEQSSADEALKHFIEGGPIWRAFWLHCWQPKRFPIYDQHVHRAMSYIRDGNPAEIPDGADRKIRSYVDEYLPFVKSRFSHLDLRAADKALWAFGRALRDQWVASL